MPQGKRLAASKGKDKAMGRIIDNRADVYQDITDQMIAMIEAGTRPWSKSWNGTNAPNIPLRSTGVPYRGINILTLWVASMTKGYVSPHWLTFKQALALGAVSARGRRDRPSSMPTRSSWAMARAGNRVAHRAAKRVERASGRLLS
jgi:hypothetical protein